MLVTDGGPNERSTTFRVQSELPRMELDLSEFDSAIIAYQKITSDLTLMKPCFFSLTSARGTLSE